MPFNQWLLPLIGGYLFVNFTFITSYWASRQGKEQLLMALALVGIVAFNSLERLFFLSVLRVEQVRTRSFVAERAIRTLWHPPRRLGRWLSRLLSPRPAPHQAGRDAQAHPADRLDALETSDGRLAPVPVLLSLKDRKVYARWLEWIRPLRADASPYLRMIPVWSGYRDAQTLRVGVTENYSEDIFSGSELPAAKVISTGDIANASLFDPEVFDRFGGESEGAEQGEADAASEAVGLSKRRATYANSEQLMVL
jgi:hypothetical protein